MSSVYILDTCSQPPLSTRHSSRLVVVIVTGEAALESVETVEDTLETVETGVEVEMVEVVVEGHSSSSLPSLQFCWPSHRWTNQRRLLRSRDQSPPITAHLLQHLGQGRAEGVINHVVEVGVLPSSRFRDDFLLLKCKNINH